MSQTDADEVGGKKRKRSARFPKLRDKIIIRDLPWTPKQRRLIDLIEAPNTKCVFISGPAGVSKTILAVYGALHMLNSGSVGEIVYIRAAVESSDSHLGFLPGGIDDKLGPYTVPFLEKLDELLDKGTIQRLKGENFLKTVAINFLRGLHMANKAVIVDEAQCATIKDLVTIMTRLGENSKILICGDPMQSDLHGSKSAGFTKIRDIFKGESSEAQGIYHFEFTSDDIVRSEFVKYIVQVLESQKISVA